jgi:hypothetical protein
LISYILGSFHYKFYDERQKMIKNKMGQSKMKKIVTPSFNYLTGRAGSLFSKI